MNSIKRVTVVRVWNKVLIKSMSDQTDETHRGNIKIIRMDLKENPSCTDCGFEDDSESISSGDNDFEFNIMNYDEIIEAVRYEDDVVDPGPSHENAYESPLLSTAYKNTILLKFCT